MGKHAHETEIDVKKERVWIVAFAMLGVDTCKGVRFILTTLL